MTAALTKNSIISPTAETPALRNALNQPFRQAETAPRISANGISLTAEAMCAPLKNFPDITSANAMTATETAPLSSRHKLTPCRRTRLGFELGLPSSSEMRRLVHRNALPFEMTPASIRNDPISVSIPIADAPSLRVIKAFSSSAEVSSKSCIAVSSIVSLRILLFTSIKFLLCDQESRAFLTPQ